MLDVFTLESTIKNPTIVSIVYSICLAFLLSTTIAITYQKTFQGLSYSRNFIHALILSSLVVAVAMQAIGDNLARGMGMMGALAIIRFRSSVKDPKDMIFIFSALATGIACGVYAFSIAVVGTFGFCLVAFILGQLPFSQGAHYDGLLRFNISSNNNEEQSILEEALKKHCRYFALMTLREVAQGERLDYAYQIKLKTESDFSSFMKDIQKMDSAKGVSLLLQEATVEV